jgi:putative ABC transport system permease protein
MMLALVWFKGLLSRRRGRLLGAIAGVALTVALLATMGVFIATSGASMTRRAISDVPVDWQVELSSGADPQAAAKAVGKTTPYTALERVGYADASGLTSTTGGTTQTTGPGKVLGIGPSYQKTYPKEISKLQGSTQGVLLAQQTAANLHAKPGDEITIERVGLPPVKVKVDGIVVLPNADSLFQAVGLPPGAAPQAPPDNVVILPSDQWHKLFDQQAKVRPDSVRTQLHVDIAHKNLPPQPTEAYTHVQQLANNVEAGIAGSGVVGDNLASRLDGVREDALYSKVLFLFLGLPGTILAMLLTLAVTSSGAIRRRREQALLRIRGAYTSQILRLEGMEALIVGAGGVALGVGLAYLAGRTITPTGMLTSANVLLWSAGAAGVGLVLAVTAVLYPAAREARRSTVAAARAAIGRVRKPLWQRLYLDLICLVISGLMFWRTASTGYQVVLAPEGVAQTSVSYDAFIAPFFLWVGVALLSVRLWSGSLDRGRKQVAVALNPIAGRLSGAVAASLARQRTLVTRGLVLVALAVSFAVSTAVFNTTYSAQSRVDAELTNGSDVTVTGPTSSPPGGKLDALRALPGAAAVQPMQHRLAYVGNDLQDLYGIDPKKIGAATPMSNAYFAGGNASATLNALSARPNGVLVSEETVMDFQLHRGDLLKLRLQDAGDHKYHVVPFHFVGVVREFPTAPQDSFLVANSSYVAKQTGTGAQETVLMRANGSPTQLAAAARKVVGPLAGAKVMPIGSAQATISSSLTAVDLHGLTRLELAFAVVFVAAATGLVMALGLTERRRTFAILFALGAKPGQLGAFLWSEGLLILVGGTLVGTAQGLGVAEMLIKVLTGVFDPPPESLSVPWGYLALLALAAVASTSVAVLGAQVASSRTKAEDLREI